MGYYPHKKGSYTECQAIKNTHWNVLQHMEQYKFSNAHYNRIFIQFKINSQGNVLSITKGNIKHEILWV